MGCRGGKNTKFKHFRQSRMLELLLQGPLLGSKILLLFIYVNKDLIIIVFKRAYE